MQDIVRKKNTGEPGNKGEFGTTRKEGSGLDLGVRMPVDTTVKIEAEARVYLDVMEELPPLPAGVREPQVSWGYGTENGERCTYFDFGDGTDPVLVWDNYPDEPATSFTAGDGPDLTPGDQAMVKAYVRQVHRNVVNALAALEYALESSADIQQRVVELATRRGSNLAAAGQGGDAPESRSAAPGGVEGIRS